MFKKIFFLLAAAFAFHMPGFSEHFIDECFRDEPDFETPSFQDRFYYVKLGGALFALPGCTCAPAASVGCRFDEKEYGLDISFNYAGKDNCFIVTVPKVLYLCNLNRQAPRGFYVGAGASLGYIHRPRRKNFGGFFGEMALGYDFNRLGRAKMFIEFTFTQPLLAVSKKFYSVSPVLSLTYGIGF